MSSEINPQYKPHSELQQDVSEFLKSLGFLHAELTYHAIAQPDFVRRLQAIFNPFALCLRGEADCVAIHESIDVAFNWEAKTHGSTTKNDMTIEAVPLAIHLNNTRFNKDCLYVYRNPNSGHIIECGFWVSEIPAIRNVYLPSRWDFLPNMRQWYIDTISSTWPDLEIKRCSGGPGSGDPFVVIDESVAHTLPHWKDLIGNMLDVELIAEEKERVERNNLSNAS